MKNLALLQRGVAAASRFAVGIAFFALIVVVTLQIATRTFGLPSPVWTEELSRYLLLYMTAFGIGLSLMTGELVNVDLLQETVSEARAWWMRLIAAICTAALGGVMIWPAWKFTTIGAFQRSPSLRWPMDIIHASVLVLSVLLFLFALLRVVGMIAGTDDGRPHLAEEA
ncbi:MULTISPECIES: TRAP transporter small permease [unclassified Paracoccus (in: a-proteobacteria)]|uniref:TRAP transporter small permease n=1 Tax=unclassified Paracoccus (in: a-proteobacteria) TaxID=2688777 RepID=UPI00091EEAB3|nr:MULTISPECIES: TRAP transporter small permease [unclassified Paracoccus (in: a-proteobacteria)]MBT0782579.1 TRAP transporter small permease [Paracoccus sp. pheM1]SFX32664.1 TRAP-type C4-dicarboxylate transport system, small permease component [Paracoccus pantotrophus]